VGPNNKPNTKCLLHAILKNINSLTSVQRSQARVAMANIWYRDNKVSLRAAHYCKNRCKEEFSIKCFEFSFTT